MLQVTRAKCLIFRSAFSPSRGTEQSWDPPLEQPRGSWRLILGNASPLWAPWAAEITPTTVGAQPLPCGFLLSMHPSGSNGLSSVLLTSPIPYQTVPFYYPEYLLTIFGSRALRTGTVLYVPPWTKLFSIPAEQQRGYFFLHCLNCCKFGLIIFFNYALKTIILGYFRFLVSFFPLTKENSRNYYEVVMGQENNRHRKRLGKREEERIALIKPHIK